MTKLLPKIVNRLTRSLGQIIPYNTHYRPVGTYKSSEEFYQANPSEAIYVCLFPELVTRLKVPEPLYKALSAYKIYDGDVADEPCTLGVKTNYHIVKVPKGRIYTDNVATIAVVAADNKVINDVSFQYHPGKSKTAPGNAIFKQKFFKKPLYYKGTVFTALTGGGAVHNYGHWLIDVLPRIYLLKESGLFDTVDWFMVPNYEFDYHKESLKMLGIDESKIINGQLVHHIQADAVIASTAPRGERSFLIPDWVTNLHRKYLLTEAILDDKPSPAMVYISRKDSGLRKVTNEDSVIDALKVLGFEILLSSKLSFREKINLFYKAKVIVSASSAGLGSLFYANSEAKLLEIFSQGFVHTHYYNMARSVGMQYNYLICKHLSPATNGKDGEREDITVDVDQLKQKVQEMLVAGPNPSDIIPGLAFRLYL
jgi:hypothetical protein